MFPTKLIRTYAKQTLALLLRLAIPILPKSSGSRGHHFSKYAGGEGETLCATKRIIWAL